MMLLLSWPPWDVVVQVAHITNLVLVLGLIYVNRRLRREMKGAYCDISKRLDDHIMQHIRNAALSAKLSDEARASDGDSDSGPQGVPRRGPSGPGG